MTSLVFVLIAKAAWDVYLHDTYQHVREEMAVTNFSYLLPFIGVAAYSIEGIGLLLPLRKDFLMSRYTNTDYKKYYFASFGFIVFLYVVFGIFNYLKFFDRIKTIVFYNYTPQNWFIFSLEIAYAVVDSLGPVPLQHDEPVHCLQLGLQGPLGPHPHARRQGGLISATSAPGSS